MNRYPCCLLLALMTAHGAADAEPRFAVLGARVMVADAEAASRFYHERLQLAWPNVAADALPPPGDHDGVVLTTVGSPAPDAYRSLPRAIVNLQVPDLWLAMRELEAQGVAFAADTINRNGIGLDGVLLTPDGDSHYLMEIRDPPEPKPPGPRVFNLELHVSDLDPAIALYSTLMGFERRTDEYWPIMPLWHGNGEFALVLSGAPDRRSGPIRSPGGHAATLLLFATDDLDGAHRRLADHPAVTIVAPPRRIGPNRRLLFADGDGIVSELWELPAIVRKLAEK